MGQFFTRERFGRPQVQAGLLLMLFLAQCLWLIHSQLRSSQPEPGELARLHLGLRQWHGGPPAGLDLGAQPAERDALLAFAPGATMDPDHSPLWYLVASAPLAVWPRPLDAAPFSSWGGLARLPFLIFGLLLGASLWYVARRLYGNAGGFIALTLYCFSPGVLRASTLWLSAPEMGAVWASFGAVFTAIAVSHTLYAPREVVLWNGRRILLLGLSLALAIGSQYSLLLLAPLALAFMLYVAHTRRAAALAIWASACGIGLLLLWAAFSFHGSAMWQALRQADFFGIAWPAFGMTGAYQQLASQFGQASPALVLALPAALVAYLAWPRARYFGNTAPLLVALLFLFLRLGTPHMPGLGFLLIAVPFLFVFVAGVFADLLETRQQSLVLACVSGLLVSSAVWNLWQLWRLRAP